MSCMIQTDVFPLPISTKMHEVWKDYYAYSKWGHAYNKLLQNLAQALYSTTISHVRSRLVPFLMKHFKTAVGLNFMQFITYHTCR